MQREVPVPFRPQAGPSPEWTPDGRELIVAGRPALVARNDTTTARLVRLDDSTTISRLEARDTVAFLYRVPVDGRAPRTVAAIRSTDGWTSVSPDGRFVVYGEYR